MEKRATHASPLPGRRTLRADGRVGVDLVGIRELLLARAWKMDADARTAGAAELPACAVELARPRQVTSLGGPPPVGEGQRLLTSSGEPEAHLAARLQVVPVVAQRSRLGGGHQLRDGQVLTGPHRIAQAGAALALEQALAPPQLGQQPVAFGPQP